MSLYMDQKKREAKAKGQNQFVSDMMEGANAQMSKIGMNVLASGRAKTIEEAVVIACKEHGPGMAMKLEENMRRFGIRGVRVTCP